MILVIAGWFAVSFVLALILLHSPERIQRRRQRHYERHLRALYEAREALIAEQMLTYDEMAAAFNAARQQPPLEPGRT